MQAQKKPAKENIEGLNNELATGMKITAKMAATTDKKERLRLFVKLVCEYYLEGKGTGVIRRGKRILAARRDLSDGEIKQLKKVKHQATVNNRIVTIIPIQNKAEIVILSSDLINEKYTEIIAQMAQFYNLDVRSKAKYWLIPIVLMGMLAIPITDKVTGKGVVIGEQSYAVSATSHGIINRVFIEAGRIQKNAPILDIETLIESEIQAAKTVLQEINTKILEQGANSTENINLLYKTRNVAEQKIRQLIVQAQNNKVLARESGIIELKENLLGSVVRKGDPLGVIEKAEQKTITTEIAVEDWIPLKAGDQAVFVPSGQTKPVQGKISTIPLNLVDGQVGKVYKIKVEMEKGMPTGTFGTIVLNGGETNIGWWLFRKQVAWLIGVTGLDIFQ